MDQNPFNALPPVVIALAVVIAGIEGMFQLAEIGMVGGQAGVGWRILAIQDYGVREQVWNFMIENRVYPMDALLRFVTYPLIHTGATHAIFVVVFVLAMGKAVGEVFSALAVLLLFWGSSVVGALAYVAILNSEFTLIGGYPGVYGLIGAFTFLLWVNLGIQGANQNRAFVLIGMLLGIQLLFGVVFGSSGDWVADLAGFVAGFLLSFVLSPGGWARVLDKLRQR